MPREQVSTLTDPRPQRLLSMRDVLDLIPVRRETIYDWRRQGRFPLPLRLGARIAWREAEILEWIEARERA